MAAQVHLLPGGTRYRQTRCMFDPDKPATLQVEVSVSMSATESDKRPALLYAAEVEFLYKKFVEPYKAKEAKTDAQ